MAKAPLDTDVGRLPITVGLLAGTLISLSTIFGGVIWFESWIDTRITVGVRSYSYELIFPRVERLESAQKRMLVMLEDQESARRIRHRETAALLNQILDKK